MKRLALLATAVVAATALGSAAGVSACTSTYSPGATDSDAGDVIDGAPIEEAASSDAGVDGAACAADLQTDPKNCGRCGRDCLGAACTAGRCEAVELGAVASANLSYLVLHGGYVYVSTKTTNQVGSAGGIWRIPQSGGAAEPYVTFAKAEAMAISGDTLYFVVADPPDNGADLHGGLWSCPLTGPAPCAPTRIAIADTPRTVTVDKGRVLYTDAAATAGVMSFTPPGPPVVLLQNTPTSSFGAVDSLFVDGDAVYLTTLYFFGPQMVEARLFRSFPDAGDQDLFVYTSATATPGDLLGSPDELYYSAYDYKNTTGGAVRRVQRSSGSGCDLGGTTVVRPLGIHTDATRVYWVNQGTGATTPYVNGSVVACARSGCCTTPDVLWTGAWPKAITGDDKALYFLTQNGTGSVRKIAKP